MGNDEEYEIFNNISIVQSMLSDLRRNLEHKFYDCHGQVFGRLTVIEKAPRIRIKSGEYIYTPSWRCDCECGTTLVVKHMDLITGEITACKNCKEN